MWVLKIRLVDKNCIWATRCKKFNVYDYQYPLSFYKVKDGLALMVYHILEGKAKRKVAYIRNAKRDKRVKRLEVRKDFMISLAIEKRTKNELAAFEAFYNPKLIYTKPIINAPDGSELCNIACFDREDLVRLFNLLKKYFWGKLLSLRQVKVPRMFTPEIMPDLTDKQYNAFKLSSAQGYYEFPRKTNLHKLAKLMKISRPTFEEHLRKAEIKLLRFMKERFLK